MASGPASLNPAAATGATLDRVGLLWLITVGWTTLVASVGAVVAGKSGLDAGVPVGAASGVLAVFAASNLWLTWRVRRGRVGATAMVAGLLVCADVVLLSWLLLRSGGVLNPASVFYLVQIVVAALVLGRSWTWIVTGLSIGGYAALFLGQSSELQFAQGMHPEIALHMRGMWLAFAGTALIIGILVSRLAVAIERRDHALDSLRERSAKASRLAGLATVVAGAAHELSTPLATMAVTARELELAVAAIPDHQELAADARLIRQEIDRSRRVLDEMAGQIAEPMGEAPRGATLGDVVAEVLGRLTPDEGARVTLRVADTSVVWPVGVVSQAVLNLLRNALQASDPPAPVEFVASQLSEERVTLTIVDRGRGMTPDELSRAGEPFFTTKPLGVGTGLGLFVARSAIERVGGTLELSSKPGRGTTATVILAKDSTEGLIPAAIRRSRPPQPPCEAPFVPRLFFPLVLLVIGALVPTAAAAQQTVNYASVGGRVTDSQGAVIVGSEVAARQTDTNLMSTVVTDAEGRFRFPYLRVGPYEITFRAQGFADARRALTVTVGGAYELAVSLSVGAIETNVTVTGDGTVLEAARTQIAGTVSQAEVKNLPMNGRNFLDLALLVPGVSLTNVGGGTQIFPETSAVPGVGISVGSQRNLSNNFIVDGLSANDDAAALSGISYGVDALDQVQVVTSGGQAELGRALGGYVNLVTRSGTNAFRGDVYSYWRDDSLNATNPLLGATLPMSQQQYGVSVGGPLVRNRTFFFGNVERRLLEQTGLVTISDANVALINARLTAVGYPGPLVTTGVYPNPIHTLHGLAKVDHQVSAGDRVSVRYSGYTVDAKNARGAGGLSAPTASAGIDNLDQTIAVSNVMSLSSRTVNETRAQIAFSDLDALPTDPIGPAVSITGVASFGTLSGAPTARRNTMYQIVDSLSYQAGAHAVRAGADVLYNDVTIVFPRAARGAYSFQNLGNFLSGTYNSPGFTQTFAETAVTQTNPNLGLYVQDEWKAGARLTLNLGLRYDLQFLETIHTDRDNVSPRLGMAWVPFESKRTVVRGSVGRFYDRVPLRALANALLSAGNTTDLANLRQIAVSLSPTQPGAPVFPNILPDVVPAVTLPALTTMDSNLQNAYSNQAGIEIEQQIGTSGTMSVGYQHVAGRRLIMSINQNVPACAVSGSNNGCRPISDYANNSQYSAAGTSVYDALLLSFVQRPARWGTYRVSYVYSKSMNNVGEAFFNAPIDNFDLSKDWGRSDDDQRHRLVVSGAISSPAGPATTVWDHLSHDLQVSGVLRGYSALPFNITSGVNTIQGTPGRPIVDGAFIVRNAGELSAFVSLDLRVSRAFAVGPHARVDALIEVFNLLNRQNTLAVNANFGAGAYPTNPSPTFRQVTAVADPRTAQIGLRVRF